jgi:hypothetical protein
MRKLLPLLIGSLALVAGSAQATPPDYEAELAQTLAGRVAGEPVDCIDLHRVRGSHIVAHTAIVYDAGSVIWVNRPRGGAETMDQWDIMVNRLYSTQLCSIDVVQLLDQGSRMYSGTVFLGAFVPYRRVQSGSAQ